MSKIYEALEKAKRDKQATQDKQARQDYDFLPPLEESPTELKELIVLNEPDSPMAECFRFLRSRVTRPAAGNPPRTILVTSALMGEGKTFVACNLAVSISRSLEEHVLLIDADLRDPSVHEVFGIPSSRDGLSTFLSKDTALSSLLKRTSIDKLSILPAGNSTETPSELLSSARMKELIREVRDRYPDRFVIIDGPPLQLTAETPVLANEVDAVIFVVRHGKTPRDAAKSALEKIQKEKLLGVVYNGYDEPARLHGKYGYYRYGYGKDNT
jgi:exopolysaccharide/PEP-CTERM locus tyrosine autokinase